MTSFDPITVGRYTLFGRIGAGGMATVHLGQQSGASGFKRIVAIKRLHPHIAKTPDLAGMLVDEARLASRISHPNVVQVLDLVQDGDELLIVMEYLRGAPLSSLLRAVRTRPSEEKTIPIPIIVSIATQMLAGLHAAHEARDADGTLLELVHRDVSPENVFVSIDGVVRLLDFGIAKAAGRIQDTREGVIKGKIAYASPEQLSGNVTRRTDVYAAGAVLWEMLAGRRLIETNGVEAVARVIDGNFGPPSAHNPAVPFAFDAIALCALSHDAADRFASAEEMARALTNAAAPATTNELAAWVASMAGDSLRSRDAEISAIESRVAENAVPTTVGITLRTPVPTTRTHGLGADPTSFLGRHADLRGLYELLRSERIVTLLGPGGIGKTRLSRRYGLLRSHDYDGVWFCDLTECKTRDDLCLALAGAIELTLTHEKDVSAVASSVGLAILAKGHALFILDNCEQVVADVAPLIEVWSSMAPNARFLCTSRERLRIGGEHVYELAPLALPENPAELASAEAVQLFAERAQKARASYALGEDVPIVAEIVRRLDGMPLAIELAAARMSVMDAKALLARLESTGFKLLVSGSRTATERQRSLRGAIEWSWSLLDPWEKSALAQCGVFRGGFWLEAAEYVVDLSAHVDAPPCMDVIQSLVEKSLVRSFEAPACKGEVRFGMYESIREFALEKLGDATQNAYARHAEHYLDAWSTWDAETWYGAIPGVPRLALERDNLLAIHARASAQPGADLLRVQIALFPLFATRGPHAGYMSLVSQQVDAHVAHVADARLRARNLLVRGRAHQLVSQREAAKRDFEHARDIAGELGDSELAARALVYLGTACRADGRLHDARLHYREALSLFERAGDRRAESVVLSALAALDLAEQKLASASALIDHAIAAARELGDRPTVGMMLIDAGVIRQELGDFDGASAAYEEAVSILEALGYVRHAHIAIGYRASLAFERNDFVNARDGYARALAGIRGVGDTKWIAVLGAELGASLACLGDIEGAEKCFAEAELHHKLEPRYTTTIAVLRGHLDLAKENVVGAAARTAMAGDLGRSSDDVRFALRVLERALESKRARDQPV